MGAQDGHAGGDRGYTLVEAVVILPLVLFFTMVVIQFGMTWHGRHIAEQAAQEAVRVAAQYQSNPGAGEAAAESFLAQVAPNLLQGVDVQVSESGDTVTAHVTATVLSVTSIGNYTVSVSASAPLERFVPSGDG